MSHSSNPLFDVMSDIFQDGMKPVSLEVRPFHLREAWRLMAEAFSSMGEARFDHQYHSVVYRMIHRQIPLLDCSMPKLSDLVLAKVNMAIFI